MRESKIEKYLRTEIAKLGGWMEKHVSPGTRGPPDNGIYWDSHSVGFLFALREMQKKATFTDPYWPVITEWAETKAPTGRYKVLQQRDHKRRRDMGFTVHVIWTMEQAEEYLRSRGKQ